MKLFEVGNFKQYAILNAPKLKPEELEIAGLSKEDVEKIITMYQAPPYQAEIIQEEFEEKKEEHEEKLETTEETLLPESAEESSFSSEKPLEIEKSEEQTEEVKELENEEASSEAKEEVPSEEREEETIIIMEHDVEYEIINGHRFMLVKDESGIEPYRVKDGQELELAGKKVRIKYG